MSIGENIKRIRKEKGLTQKQLGELCGLADSAIRRYENGGANPKRETLKKIAKALDISYLRLTGEIPDGEHGIIIKSKNGTEHFFSTTKLINAIDKAGSLKISPDDLNIQDSTESDKMLNNTLQDMLVKYFDLLNNQGKNVAITQVEMLTKIPEYKKEET